jgi:Uma2 family endonuclease
MSALPIPPQEPYESPELVAATEPSPRLFSRDEFYRLGELGFFGDERVELIHGVLCTMPPIGPDHASYTARLTKLFVYLWGESHQVRIQSPISLGDSEVQPDVAIAESRADDYEESHPETAVLVVEIAKSSLAYDRGPKSAIYASAGIADYWIVNLNNQTVEVRRDPAEAPEPGYLSVRIYRKGEEIAPLAAPDKTVKVSDLFP